jgi:hypothetical protein
MHSTLPQHTVQAAASLSCWAALISYTILLISYHVPPDHVCCHCFSLLLVLLLLRSLFRVSCVTFSAGDTLLVAGYEDGSARCFDWRSRECLCIRAASKAKRKQTSSELTAVVAPSW